MLELFAVGPKFTRPAADNAHRPPLHGLAAAARVIHATDGRADRQTRRRFNTLAAYAVHVVTLWQMRKHNL